MNCKIPFCAICRFDKDQVIIVKSGFFSDDNDDVRMERYESFCKYKIQTNFHPNEVRTAVTHDSKARLSPSSCESILYRQTFLAIIIPKLEDGISSSSTTGGSTLW